MQLKRNLTIIATLTLLAGILLGMIGRKYGIPNLLLYPEYLNNVGVLSHLILGFSVGGFISAVNVISYVENGFRFPFIVTLNNPFLKFCINNFIIPSAFIVLYVYRLWRYQTQVEFLQPTDVWMNVGAFLVGVFVFVMFSLVYFSRTDNSLFTPPKDIKKKSQKYIPIKGLLHRNEKWYHIFSRNSDWRIETYISGMFSIRLARSSVHYSRANLTAVFEKNQMNSSFFQIMVVMTILLLGIFHNFSFFVIPAGASIFLMLTFFLMIYGAIFSWFKTWASVVLVVLFIGLNYLVLNGVLDYRNSAYGFDYSKKDVYDNERIVSLAADDNAVHTSLEHEFAALNRWKLQTGEKKPWMVIVNTSGGGLRSALYTYQSLRKIDEQLEGKLSTHLRFVSGASGGMIGAALFRERMLLPDSMNATLDKGLRKDLLNPVAFTLAVHDILLRFGSDTIAGYEYPRDRGMAFENALNRNTAGVFQRYLGDYKTPVASGQLPHIVFSPSIANDGRVLLFSSQPIRYMMRHTHSVESTDFVEFVEARSLFSNQNVDSLRYSTILRMNATFPYILPNVSLPTQPRTEVMDAGLRDNLGVKVSARYIQSIQDWAKQHLAGIVVLQLTDAPHEIRVKDQPSKTVIEQVFTPLGAVYENLFNTQRFQAETIESYNQTDQLGLPVKYLKLSLPHDEENYIALSWHLTEKEKLQIDQATTHPHFQEIVDELRKTLKR